MERPRGRDKSFAAVLAPFAKSVQGEEGEEAVKSWDAI